MHDIIIHEGRVYVGTELEARPTPRGGEYIAAIGGGPGRFSALELDGRVYMVSLCVIRLPEGETRRPKAAPVPVAAPPPVAVAPPVQAAPVTVARPRSKRQAPAAHPAGSQPLQSLDPAAPAPLGGIMDILAAAR